jgi:hypothetical protein
VAASAAVTSTFVGRPNGVEATEGAVEDLACLVDGGRSGDGFSLNVAVVPSAEEFSSSTRPLPSTMKTPSRRQAQQAR